MKYLGDVLIGIAALAGAALVGFLLYTIFVYMPVNIYTEAKCLRQGYPKARVSVGLEQYCMNLDGSVTVKVDHQ